jgi:CheY-like chemotaxis protein
MHCVRKVLLVEDEVVVAIAVRLTLESLGYGVALAADGREGLAKIQAAPPDIVVTDYMMPRMDGIEMLKAMRADGYEKPAVLVTSVPEERLPDGAKKLYQAYLPKPFRDESLVAVIRRLLRVNDAG